MHSPRFRHRLKAPFAVGLLLAVALLAGDRGSAQDTLDRNKANKAAKALMEKMTVRVRVTKTTPDVKEVLIGHRYGGEGQAGDPVKGDFKLKGKVGPIPVGEWSDWTPLNETIEDSARWAFGTVTVVPVPIGKKKNVALEATTVEFEIANGGRVFKRFTEEAPNGATVGFAAQSRLLGEKGFGTEFVASVQGLSTFAKARREAVQKAFPKDDPLPKKFVMSAHVGGYGEADPDEGAKKGKGLAAGYGVRHSNPAILADEFSTLRTLGINSLDDSIRLAKIAGVSEQFRTSYRGGPGSGTPMMAFFRENRKIVEGCPHDAGLKKYVVERAELAVKEHKEQRDAGTAGSWGQWGDEINVYAKDHYSTCPKCGEEFRVYLRSQKLTPEAFGKTAWEDVTPYAIWREVKQTDGKLKKDLVPPPASAADALRYYYTYRFMTHATGQIFAGGAAALKKENIPLYTMQTPSPSWAGSALNWHEFYDGGANTAVVWETSNRDPRAWPWESYLGDLARGIAADRDWPLGVLLKPHRGGAQQRMLSVVTRGVTFINWYTYGPDYAKGDSFSSKHEFLVDVGTAARFLGKAEDYLYGAKWAGKPEVAFVRPQSSDIWGDVTDPDSTSLEDAKWVYTALAHAQIPMDVLSERQLAEKPLSGYKVIYVLGPNLRRDAADKLLAWVDAGGVLWTDMLGLSRDEANQPLAATAKLLGTGRKLEGWGSAKAYHSTDFKVLAETAVPKSATVAWTTDGAWGRGKVQAAIGREALGGSGQVVARFSDGKAAAVRVKVGQGEVVAVGLWAGLTYSARVRRDDYDMTKDFDPAVRALIAAPALERKVYRPVTIPSAPVVEPVFLEKDGQRTVALINWGYKQADPKGPRPHDPVLLKNARVELPGCGEVKAVRSLLHGPLKVEGTGAQRAVVLPRLDEIDLLILE